MWRGLGQWRQNTTLWRFSGVICQEKLTVLCLVFLHHISNHNISRHQSQSPGFQLTEIMSTNSLHLILISWSTIWWLLLSTKHYHQPKLILLMCFLFKMPTCGTSMSGQEVKSVIYLGSVWDQSNSLFVPHFLTFSFTYLPRTDSHAQKPIPGLLKLL